MREIDERYITKEFLEKYFSAKSLFQSKEKYIRYRENLNQKRRTSGKNPLCDGDLSQIIDELFKAEQ